MEAAATAATAATATATGTATTMEASATAGRLVVFRGFPFTLLQKWFLSVLFLFLFRTFCEILMAVGFLYLTVELRFLSKMD